MSGKKRSSDQTATAFSLDRELFEAMEKARKELHLDRSNFIRMAVQRQINAVKADLEKDRNGLNSGAEKKPDARQKGSHE